MDKNIDPRLDNIARLIKGLRDGDLNMRLLTRANKAAIDMKLLIDENERLRAKEN